MISATAVFTASFSLQKMTSWLRRYYTTEGSGHEKKT